MMQEILQRWFLLFFPVLWLMMLAVLSLVSGWYKLSKRFPLPKDFNVQETFKWAYITLGLPYLPVAYKNCVTIAITDAGVKLSVMFLYRVLTSPLLIPWRKIESVKQIRLIGLTSTIVQIKNETRRLRFYYKPAQRIFEICKQKGIRFEM